VPVRGIILNEYEGETVAERTNPAVVERMTDVSVATVPTLALEDPSEVIAGVREHVPRAFAFGNQ
jgi:dethiobiotin synthetase